MRAKSNGPEIKTTWKEWCDASPIYDFLSFLNYSNISMFLKLVHT